MRTIKLVLIAIGAVLALCAFGVSSASALQLPLFIAKSGKYPVDATIHGGEGKFVTASGHEVKCALVSGSGSFGLHLGILLLLLHKCTTTLFFTTVECNSPGESGQIHIEIHGWLGYLTNAAGEKKVGVLGQPESGKTFALAECNANAFEHVHVEILGEQVGTIGASELNKLQKKGFVEFTQTGGHETPQTFLLPEPLSLMTGIHMTSDITGSINETTESALESTREATLLGTEEGLIAA